MVFNFPKPEVRRTYELYIDTKIFRSIDNIAVEKGISAERVLEVFIEAAHQEYITQQEIKKGNVAVGSIETPPIQVAAPEKKPTENTQSKQAEPIANLEHPSEKKAAIEKQKDPIKVTSEKTNSPKWSIKYDRCVKCGTTDRKHMAKGFCTQCYFKKDEVTPQPPKTFEKTTHQKKMEARQLDEDKHFKSVVVTCANKNCQGKRKFIKGMGTVYKGEEYCRELCLEEILNDGNIDSESQRKEEEYVI